MKISRLSIAVMLIAMLACSSEKETPKGYKFTVVKKGDGIPVTPGKFLLVDLFYKDGKDSIWFDNRKGTTFQKLVPVTDTSNIRFEEGFAEVFRMLSKGDSVVMTTTVQVFYEKTVNRPVPAGVDPKSNLTFCARALDVLDTAQVEKIQEEMMAKQNEERLRLSTEQLAKDTLIIDAHLKEKSLVANRTKSGLRYIVTRKGKGDQAKAGQTVSVDYAGYLLSGKHFDTSIEQVAKKQNMYNAGRAYQPYTFVVGTASVIDGWDQMLMLMNKGSKVTVYIPSTLAYGSSRRSDDIVENSILVFDMELIDIK